MDWIDITFRVWIVCGILAFILGLWWDAVRERLHKHVFGSLTLYGVICLFLGPIALGIVIDLWLKHKG